MKLGEYIAQLREGYWYAGQIPIAIRYENNRYVGTKKKPCNFVCEVEKYHPEILDKEVIEKIESHGEMYGDMQGDWMLIKSIEVLIKDKVEE